MLMPNCSEEVFRLKLPPEWLDERKQPINNFISQMIKKFKPYNYDNGECKDFILFDEFGSGDILIKHRDDDGDRLSWMESQCRELGIAVENIENLQPLFSIGRNFFYAMNNIVYVANLGYCNNKEMDEENKRLLTMWRIQPDDIQRNIDS